jgi:ATP-dependent Clp protease ATP-binding subunit ClpA
LTEAVRRRPYSVVLLDEVEKAHPEVFDVLLQVLDDGRLTDGQGRVVDFKNVILILTSNLGSQFLIDPELNDSQKHEGVMAMVRGHFKPEFLNRVDETIVFPQLTMVELAQIVDLFIKRLAVRLEDRDMTIEVAQAAKDRLIEIGFDPALGARPLRRAVQREVEVKLSAKILHGELGAASHVTVDFVDGAFTFVARAQVRETVTQAL